MLALPPSVSSVPSSSPYFTYTPTGIIKPLEVPPYQPQNEVVFQQPYNSIPMAPPPPAELPAPAVGALVGATTSIVELLPLAPVLLGMGGLTLATQKALATTPEARSALGGITAILGAIGLSSLGGFLLRNAGLGALAGIFYKRGNPFRNWRTAPPVPLQEKLFGGPPQLLDAQTWGDRQEIHNAKIRSAAWGLIPGPFNTLYRLFGQDPVKLALERRDV